MTIMVRRVAATQSVVDAWKGRPFELGRHDCARLGAAMLRAMGHRVPLARWGAYKTEAGARRALAAQGHADLADVLDALGLTRIPYAGILTGDLVGFRHPEQILGVALGVVVAANRVLAFMDDGDGAGPCCHVFPPVMTASGAEYLAWRTDVI